MRKRLEWKKVRTQVVVSLIALALGGVGVSFTYVAHRDGDNIYQTAVNFILGGQHDTPPAPPAPPATTPTTPAPGTTALPQPNTTQSSAKPEPSRVVDLKPLLTAPRPARHSTAAPQPDSSARPVPPSSAPVPEPLNVVRIDPRPPMPGAIEERIGLAGSLNATATLEAAVGTGNVGEVTGTKERVVTWEVIEPDCGTVTSEGMYRGPSEPRACHVRVRAWHQGEVIDEQVVQVSTVEGR
jgi:hypothetical protein